MLILVPRADCCFPLQHHQILFGLQQAPSHSAHSREHGARDQRQDHVSTTSLPSRTLQDADCTALVDSTTETEISAAETTHRNAARELQRIETALDIAKKKVKSYNETAENNKAQIAAKLTELESEEVTVEAAIKDAQQEVDFARGEVAAHETYVKFYKTVLDKGKKNHVCIGCNRGLADNDMGDFEAYVSRAFCPLPPLSSAVR